jgi:hypothetical protein
MSTSRRNFLTYLGFGSLGMLGVPASTSAITAQPARARRSSPPSGFTPIRPSSADCLILPSGFRYDVVGAWGDKLGTRGPYGEERFGFDCDFNAFFPLDSLAGGKNSREGLLWTNNEWPIPHFVSGYSGKSPKTEQQIIAEKLSVGGSVVHVKQEGGRWKRVPGSRHTRRFTALYPNISMVGPAASVVPVAVGTLANCSGGTTPWHTVLSCEENFQDYNSKWHWQDVLQHKIDERQYGWVVEVDPFNELPPQKLSALGRFAHENVAWSIGPTGRIVCYMGDDAQNQCLYKFVSAAPYRAGAIRTDSRRLLSEGTLYVADMGAGRWLPLDIGRSPKLREAGFKTQSDVMIRTREAAKVVGGTPLDRPEDCEVHPLDGTLYVALTNNTKHGNFYGQIMRLLEKDENPEGEAFRYEIFLAGGPQSGLACPDNLAFDREGNLWVATDISSASMGDGAYESFHNNGLFVVPTRGAGAGEAWQFASGPVEAEITGPWFTPDGKTLFLGVQHPGEESTSMKELTSHWPDGGSSVPRPSVVAITGF